jgi:hypothetical protein
MLTHFMYSLFLLYFLPICSVFTVSSLAYSNYHPSSRPKSCYTKLALIGGGGVEHTALSSRDKDMRYWPSK